VQAIYPSRRKQHEQITGICGRDVAEGGRFAVSRHRQSRHLSGNRRSRQDRAPHDIWLRRGLAHQFVVLPVLAIGSKAVPSRDALQPNEPLTALALVCFPHHSGRIEDNRSAAGSRHDDANRQIGT
jgi:hypothetical protein